MPDATNDTRRIQRVFGGLGETTALGPGHESLLLRLGPPGELDAQAIEHRLCHTALTLNDVERAGIAQRLVTQARQALLELAGGTRPELLQDGQRLGLEAILQTRGRPSLRVLDDGIEDLRLHPGAELWQAVADLHQQAVFDACQSTAAVRVRDTQFSYSPWVQGSAWMVAPGLAMTNRHVLFPPGGRPLAARGAATAGARILESFEVTLDFAFQQATTQDRRYRVVGVPFVAAVDDPVDVALLEVEHISGPQIAPLNLSRQPMETIGQLYVIGHPGRVIDLSDEVRCVFGDPDERKRVSFGQPLNGDVVDADELLHDASTIGGFSGGPVLDFLDSEVRALHYWGDPLSGNRAIAARALWRHPQLSAVLACANGAQAC
ncbi:trypsin-like serine peptidase [Pseudomonas soli]|uniref:trypsin-like serine peptidase n=1 Tax=Pseudomonas soli TaxID=1306993 RepID=UPI0004F80341|nr:hypothetical protein O165_008310 [Pseudomonas soli]